MKLKILIFTFLFYTHLLKLSGQERLSSEPFISGDTFRKIADFTFDNDYSYYKVNAPFDPHKVQKGDIIFVSTEPEGNLFNFFANYHPKIKESYILITHNGDGSTPNIFKKYLEDKKLFTWFGQNPDINSHPKFIPIPIGVENVLFNRNYKQIITELISKQINKEKKYLFYVNFSTYTNQRVREPLLNFFKNQDFCYCIQSKKDLYSYLTDVCHSKFILSPEGNGLDCIRTWEALYLNTIPIVKTSPLDELFKDLPVLIVKNYEDITEEYLEKEFLKMKIKKYRIEKIYFNYWLKLIKQKQKECRSN